MAKPSNKTMTTSGAAPRVAAASRQARENMEAAGIPDSKPFIAKPGELESGVDRILKCHINGHLVGDLNLDPQVLGALDYWSTDEGMAERNARPNVREDAGRVKLGADGFDKALAQRRDDVLDRDMGMYEARDPLKEVADAHQRPGFKPKFLSDKKVKENGTTGDYEIAKDDKGDPVKVRGMVLGHAPIERVEARNRHFRQRGNQALKQIGEQYTREGGATAVTDQ